jgi:predicted N-acetyltransferase YhbS
MNSICSDHPGLLKINSGVEMNIKIRQETEKDHDQVYQLVRSAFENMAQAGGDEQDLVDRLRRSSAFIPELSLVAVGDVGIVGHILFTKMKIGSHPSLALAPVAVLPGYQKMGIGGQLIREGHRIAKNLGFTSVIVVGHASYYPRFGYLPASRWRITAPFEVPDEAFMVIELVPGALENVNGMIAYAREFFPDNSDI